jgi:hypothetical protein
VVLCRVVEVLVIFGLISCIFLAFLQWLSSLPVFPALVAGAILCPFLSIRDYELLVRALRLQGHLSKRDPIPPERFYWPAQKRRLGRLFLLCSFVSLSVWCNAAILPASLQMSVASVAGWLNALAGILTLTRAISTGALYFQASQWFDPSSPTVVGLLRRAMYRLSDNYEYLRPTRRDPEKEEVY